MNNKLTKQLKKIESVIDTDNILSEQNDTGIIQSYYRVNKLAYRIFHNRKGYLHMGISKNGKFSPQDLEVPLQEIEKHIIEQKATKVLELASGHGANSLFLAKRNTNVEFHAMDFSTQPRKEFNNLHNTNFQAGDFHDLSNYESSSFDLVFIIEALCHASDKGKVIQEVARVLNSDGRFIILDGYYSKPLSELNPQEQKAAKLTSVGMAVEEFMYIGKFREVIKSTKFKILEETDLSQKILPTMERFGKLARVFFKLGFIAKLLQRVLPNMFIRNSISGLLMPTLIRHSIAKYYRHVLVK
jgi:ubiquinone/menaquinone biosynthesis C-methylase UbiE